MRLIHSLLALISITTSNASVTINVTNQFHDAGNTGDWFTYGHCDFMLSQTYNPGDMAVEIVTNYPVSSSKLTYRYIGGVDLEGDCHKKVWYRDVNTVVAVKATNMTVTSATGNIFYLSNRYTEHPGSFTVSFELRYPTSGSLAGYCASNIIYVEATTPGSSTAAQSTESTSFTETTTITSTTTQTTESTTFSETTKINPTTQTTESTTFTETTKITSSTMATQAPASSTSSSVGETAASTYASSNIQTTGPVSQSVAQCMCACKEMGSAANINYTTQELAKKIDEIVKALTIDKKQTSVAQRKRQSARDDRPSARAVGTVGVVLLSVTLGVLILFDIDNFLRFINEVKKSRS